MELDTWARKSVTHYGQSTVALTTRAGYARVQGEMNNVTWPTVVRLDHNR